VTRFGAIRKRSCDGEACLLLVTTRPPWGASEGFPRLGISTCQSSFTLRIFSSQVPEKIRFHSFSYQNVSLPKTRSLKVARTLQGSRRISMFQETGKAASVRWLCLRDRRHASVAMSARVGCPRVGGFVLRFCLTSAFLGMNASWFGRGLRREITALTRSASDAQKAGQSQSFPFTRRHVSRGLRCRA